MSYDGSSAKSYIRHATEKERLDNLAFASFPEDYLPYAANPGHSRAPPPPYLLWGDDHRRRPPGKRKGRRGARCAGALLCAIGLVVIAILAVVAISVYLGVVTNLFRSPVVSVSGRFTSGEEGDDFSRDLLNSSSPRFTEMAQLYKSKVERAFYSSPLEPAFIAARIYSFRPGLVVYFRVYLDRRKMREGTDSSPAAELVRDLVTQKLASDPDSVHVEENEELLSVDPSDAAHSPVPTTTTKQPISKHKKERRPPSPSAGVGEWRPVPIEDSVSPSFAERPLDGAGPGRSPDEASRRRPPPESLDSPLSANQQPAVRIQPPSGSVRLSEVANPREGTGLLEEISPAQESSAGGVGTVRVLEPNPPKAPRLTDSLGTGSVSLLDDPLLPVEGVGSVRLIDESPPKVPTDTRAGTLKELDDIPPKTQVGLVRSKEPPTLAPSVSLVVRKPSRSDRPHNVPARPNVPVRLAKIQQNADLVRDQPEGVGSIREIITEVDFPPPLQNRPLVLASDVPDSDLESVVTSTTVQDDVDTTLLAGTETSPLENATEIPLDDSESEADDPSSSESREDSSSVLSVETTFEEETTQELSTLEMSIITLENILFNRASKPTPVSEISPRNATATTEITDEDLEAEKEESVHKNHSTTSNDEETVVLSSGTTADQDIHSSIINYSQYLFDEHHYHVMAEDHAGNVSAKDTVEAHTIEGHGFHQPARSPDLTTDPSSSSVPLTTSSVGMSDFLEYYSFNRSSGNASSDYDGWSEEEANETTDDGAQQAKIVPQVQSDILSNDIGEDEASFDDEILRHVTPAGQQTNGSLMMNPPEECPPGSVPCGDDRGKCGARCDLRRDCPNNADEEGCSCSDLLRAMGQSQKMCDGVEDCADRSDETGCPWCPSSGDFVCPGSRACVPLEKVCDGRDDCPGGQDEKRCVSLSESSSAAGSSSEYGPEGYLVVRKRGRWGKLCLDTLPASTDTDRRIAELGRAVCSALTYRNMTSSVRAVDRSGSEDSFYQISTDVANDRSSAVTSIFESTACDEKKVLRVRCASLECGLRPSSSQRRRIVGGRSAEGAGAWPWSVALYREGEFQCGAALVSDKWMLSAAHCFYSSPHAYWTARLGVLRRGSELPSGGERVRRIDHIVLHPDYEDVGFINDIALLRMDKPVAFSDSLRPICLPSSPREDATLWHGQRCSVVGWGKLYEIGHTFPDSLQEVRLPVISSSECQKRSIFLPAYRITPRMFCAGFDRGGRDACLGDSGGPMACQRPADGRWILLGVTSNGDGCGRPGRPGVYSQVSGFLTWIQETIAKEVLTGGATGSESPCRGGVRCRLGRCVPGPRVCDGRRDCAGGEDEEGC